MKFRLSLLVLVAILSLSGCVSLSEDITPPPGYVPPTPAPTLGPLFPEQQPVPANGAALYAEKCAPCHGDTGLGNGPQSKVLSVNVPAIGLPEIISQYSPASYYTTVTQGRMDKMMPPFASLTDAERWDVVAFVYSLSTTPEQVAQGKAIYEANCLECHGASGTQAASADFTDAQFMAQRTNGDFVRFIVSGGPGMPAYPNLSEDELWAVTSYLRTFSFGAAPEAVVPESNPTPEPATPTPDAAATPEATPDGTVTPEATEAPAPTAVPGVGPVSGSVVMASGSLAPADATVTLLAYDHGDNSQAPELIEELPGVLESDGTFTIENVNIPEGRFFIAEVTYAGIPYQSEIMVAEANASSLEIAPITVYETTEDFSGMRFDRIHIGFSFPDGETIQVFHIYIFSNTGDKTIVVKDDGSTIPFINLPEGASNPGFEDAGMGGTFVAAEGGFAIPPSDQQYGIVAYYEQPYEKKIDVSTLFDLPVDAVTVFVQPGLKLAGDTLVKGAPQDIQGFTYDTYEITEPLAANASLAFTVSGKPESSEDPATSADNLDTNTIILIVVGVLGLILIGVGVWMFLRDRSQGEEDEEGELEDEDEPENNDSPETLMDAINALDDQYKAGNLAKEVYEDRRAELKAKLKALL